MLLTTYSDVDAAEDAALEEVAKWKHDDREEIFMARSELTNNMLECSVGKVNRSDHPYASATVVLVEHGGEWRDEHGEESTVGDVQSVMGTDEGLLM